MDEAKQLLEVLATKNLNDILICGIVYCSNFKKLDGEIHSLIKFLPFYRLEKRRNVAFDKMSRVHGVIHDYLN